MRKVRIGVIGLGQAGVRYAQTLKSGGITGAMLAAVCTRTESKLTPFRRHCSVFTDFGELIESGSVDAVIIATPHQAHVPIGIAALDENLHVLVDKPLCADVGSASKLVAAHRRREVVFAAFFQLRTDPLYIKIRDIVRSGELGTVNRFSWTFTEWYRPQAYYESADWRGTWDGEGGGVLINQAPHFLDLIQWIFGIPQRIRAHCRFHHYHRIEVEDDVTAYLDYGNKGPSGVFIASTGEAPGTNRLEIAADRGKLVAENKRIQTWQLDESLRKHTRKAREPDAQPRARREQVKANGTAGGHAAIIQNFVDAIRKREPLIAPAAEGLLSLEMANAMIYSSCKETPVELPLDSRSYARLLTQLRKETP